MKLLFRLKKKRRTIKEVKSEIARITKELDKFDDVKFMSDQDFVLWHDYNGMLKALEWDLKLRNDL